MITFLKAKPLFWIIPLYIFWQLIHLWFLRPDFLMTYPEELYRGTMALELNTGLLAPFLSYMPDDYAGGSIVVALLASLFFKILGPNLLALKIVPLVIFTLALFFWYKGTENTVSKKAALYFSLLYTFSSFQMMQFMHSHMGDHPETILFMGMAFYFLFKIVNSKKPSITDCVWLGLTCGFGVWFAYIYSLMVLSIGIFLLLFKRDLLFSKKAFILIASFVIGFSPWLFMNISSGFSGLFIHKQTLSSFFNLSNILNLFTDFKESVPFRFSTSFGLPGAPAFWNWKFLNLLYITLFISPIFISLISKEKRKFFQNKTLLFFCIYTFIFIFFSQLSSFRSIRFMIPLYPILYFISAFFLAHFKKASPLIVFIIAFTSIFSNTLFFSPLHAGSVAKTNGYNYFYLSYAPGASQKALCETTEKCLSFQDRFRKRLNIADFHTFNSGLALKHIEELNLNVSETTRSSLKTYYKNYFDYYLGWQLYDHHENLMAALKEAARFPNHQTILLGIADGAGYGSYKVLDAPKKNNAFFSRMQGEQWFNVRAHQIKTSELEKTLSTAITSLEPEMKSSFLEGVGRSITRHRIEDGTPMALSIINTLPKDWQDPLLKGSAHYLESAECIDSYPVERSAIYHELSAQAVKKLKQYRTDYIKFFLDE